MNRLTILLVLSFWVAAQTLTVDSVIVDSIWNSDSSWYDNNGIFQQRISRDCFVGFKPAGQGMTRCYLSLSIDSGKTWMTNSDSMFALDSGIASHIQCGTVGRVKIRVLGPDRPNVAFKISAQQDQPVILGNPKAVAMGLTVVLDQGDSCVVDLNCKTDTSNQDKCFAPISKIYWDGFGNGNWDDSTSLFAWKWRTIVPTGTVCQKKSVILKARDLNGLWSAPCTLTAKFLGLRHALDMVAIPQGAFMMGSRMGTGARPIHNVTISAFSMGSTEVTRELYKAVFGNNLSANDTIGANYPISTVSWNAAVLFCNALSNISGKDTVYKYSGTIGSYVLIDYTKNGYRLPTEAEWEYACRAGTTTDYYWGRNYPPSTHDDTLAIDSNAVWHYNTNGNSLPVAGKKPNAWGLYDMSGNLWEWVNDLYGAYTADAQTDPIGNPAGYQHLLRGGCWGYFGYYNYSSILCSADRRGNDFDYDDASVYFSFRIACRP